MRKGDDFKPLPLFSRLSMGQNPNRPPSKHQPIQPLKLGSIMGGASYRTNMGPTTTVLTTAIWVSNRIAPSPTGSIDPKRRASESRCHSLAPGVREARADVLHQDHALPEPKNCCGWAKILLGTTQTTLEGWMIPVFFFVIFFPTSSFCHCFKVVQDFDHQQYGYGWSQHFWIYEPYCLLVLSEE